MQGRRIPSPRILLGLAIIVAGFVTVSSWNIGQAGFSGFTSTAAKSMSLDWRAFWFGSFDPGVTITLDKLPGFLVPQALSARLFGFHAWSLALPQIIEGAITIVAVFVIAARLRGPRIGLVAATIFALTPLEASMFGHVMEDGLLTMSLAVAFAFWQSSLRSGRWAPLIVAGVVIGVGFQAKMAVAWILVPGFVIALLFFAAGSRAARVARAAVLSGVTLVTSLAWMVVVQLTPAAARPFIDGSTDDNVFSMVFGYNGLNRLFPGLVPGAAGSFTPSVLQGDADGTSFAKLLLPSYATQIGWLYPLALLGLVVVVVRLAKARGTAAERATLAGMAVWFVLSAVLLSVSPVPHTAYFSSLAVQIAVLAGVGVASLVARLRQRQSRPAGFGSLGALGAPVALVAQLAWTAVLLTLTGVAPWWLLSLVIAAGVAALLAVAVRRSRLALVLAAVAVFAGPLVWTASVTDLHLAGTADDAYAGPRLHAVPYFFQTTGTAAERESFAQFQVTRPLTFAQDPALTPQQERLVAYAHGSAPHSRFVFATGSWGDAAPYIVARGLPVLPLGGFSGETPSPTLREVKSLIADGELRFFLLPTDTTQVRSDSGRAPLSARTQTLNWVLSACSYVPDDVYQGATTLPGQSLWDCVGAR
jgi:4-amino-4-deoxy-L-arabinose transferase-like glycosyltransferase